MRYGDFKYGEWKYGLPTQTLELSANVTATADTKKKPRKIISALVSANVSFKKGISKYLSALVSITAKSIKKTSKALSSMVTVISTFTKKPRKVITALVSVSSSFSKNIKKIIRAVVDATIHIRKHIHKSLTALVNVVGRVYKFFRVYPTIEVTEYDVTLELEEYTVVIEVIGMAYAGSTITLKGSYKNEAGDFISLEDVAFKIYAPSRVLLETITPTEISTGVYQCEYTIPEGKYGQFDIEFYGVLGTRTLRKRISVDSVWR